MVFPSLLAVMIKITNKGISPRNAAKLLNMLLDPTVSWRLKIELAATVEGLFDLRNDCYFLESDATDMPFKVAERIGNFLSQFSGGKMKSLPSADRLMMEVSSHMPMIISMILHPHFLLALFSLYVLRLLIGL